jgi:1-aminocyclopropane-1-carboxylate deaminase/D-cysteine desulfhydrase-like pyridoxal-dependent ACC family enzyme
MDALMSFEFYNDIPRLSLAQSPTPLAELKKLSDFLKGPRIFMKREDLSGFAMGGNKVRKFEFFMADALQKGADCCIAIGGIQSNHTRVTAASALHCGLKTYLLLMGEKPSDVRGNLILDYLLGSEIVYIPEMFDFEGRLNAMLRLADNLKRDGKKPYVLPVVSPLGCMGPLMAMEETLKQAEMMNIHFSHQFVSVGSGETLVGLVMGVAFGEAELETVGVCIGRNKEQITPILEDLIDKFKALVLRNQKKGSLKYSLLDTYLGKSGHPTKEGLDAIRLVAKTEGIFLDPIYTGKAMAAILDLIQKRRFRQDENILFWNTSSPPIFFAYDDYLSLA